MRMAISKRNRVKTGKPDAKAYEEVQNMSRMLNIDLTLKKLLED